MAAHPLVEQSYRELPSLISLSLRQHNIPVRLCFWLHSIQTGQWRIVIQSPLVDQDGARTTFEKVAATLQRETFMSGLRLSDLVLIGEHGAAEVESAIRRGTFRLDNFGTYEDVEIYPVPDASKIRKQGFLHIAPADGDVIASFAPFDRSGSMKPRKIRSDEVSNFLRRIGANGSQEHEVNEALRNRRSDSILIQIDMQTIYDEGLI